jgi:cytoskeletal protein RodZ
VAVAGRNDDDERQPWHNRTPAVVGASLAALVVVGILIVAATAMARQFGEPEQAPLDFVAPTYSVTDSQSAASATTTQTITSTSPPETTDINPSSTSGSSSSSTTSGSSESSTEQTTARTEDTEIEDRPTRTSRQRPRTNVTRTFNPYP